MIRALFADDISFRYQKKRFIRMLAKIVYLTGHVLTKFTAVPKSTIQIGTKNVMHPKTHHAFAFSQFIRFAARSALQIGNATTYAPTTKRRSFAR